jgi:hypothetical protein
VARHPLLAFLGAAVFGCSSGPTPGAIAPQAGFLEVPPRTVTLKGQSVAIEATGRLFYNFLPADTNPAEKPIIVLFNGFADDMVRAYGTGRETVVSGGEVLPNASSFTRFANLVYVEPRQAGYSYDVLFDRTPLPADCAPDIFNEYVDAADVLLAVLEFLSENPNLEGPVYWLGESYAGVRITWILAYLRGHWDLVPYADPLLEARIGALARPGSAAAGQVLLEAWIAGGAERVAIEAECGDPVEIAAVSSSLGISCASVEDACSCTTDDGHSLYNYTYTTARETERETLADLAHVVPERAAALLGVPLTTIPLLGNAERAKGFKCLSADGPLPYETVPPEEALVAALGPLPAGQSYFVPYSPLLPTSAIPTADWQTLDLEAVAFADNLHDVPTFLTKGDKDLVVPTLALAPALRAALGDARVDSSVPARLGIRYSDGERFVAVFDYPSAGHMVEMVEPAKLANDLEAWLLSTAE